MNHLLKSVVIKYAVLWENAILLHFNEFFQCDGVDSLVILSSQAPEMEEVVSRLRPPSDDGGCLLFTDLHGFLDLCLFEIVAYAHGIPVLRKLLLWGDNVSKVNLWIAVLCS